MRYLDRLQPVALLALRLVLGAVMIDHGYLKGFGGFSHPVQVVSGLGLPGWLAYGFAAAEFFGGIALVVGLLTRLAALAILIDLAVTLGKVHWKNGLFSTTGYQFPLACAAMAFALIFFGAGPIALDAIAHSGTRSKKT